MRMLLLLLLVACDRRAASDTAELPRLAVATSPVVRPGGILYLVLDDVLAADLEIELAGHDVSSTPRDLTRTAVALYDLPDDLPLGPSELRFWDRNDPARVQLRPIEVVDPIFATVNGAFQLGFVHRTLGWPRECAESLTGVGVADHDMDGDLDVFIGNLTGDSVLFRNDGDENRDGLPELTRWTAEAGLSGQDLVSNVSFADYDNDGDKDLFLGRRGSNRLLENRAVPDGVATYVDVTDAAGLATDDQRTMGSAWGDYDGDGDLDLYVLNHTWCFPGLDGDDPRSADALYRNDRGVFVDVSDLLDDGEGKVTGRFGFTGLWLDHDRDGDQDLFVINDHVPNGGRSVVWRNDGPTDDGWAFHDITGEIGFAPLLDVLGKTVNAMGAAVGDVNHDGRPDFAYTNIGQNFLVVSDEDGMPRYRDVSIEAGIARTLLPWDELSVTWGTHLFDHDNDGDLDLFYVGGALKGSEPQPHAFFDNRGDGSFDDRTWEYGLESTAHGKASALVDLDEDGFFELIVMNWGDRPDIYRNTLPARGNENHWLRIDLVGDGVRVNRDAFGAIVELSTPDDVVQTCFRNPMPSLSATGDPTCHFGLGAHTSVADARVIWPDGTVQSIEIDAVDRRIEVALAP